jgi:hypothetical protein
MVKITDFTDITDRLCHSRPHRRLIPALDRHTHPIELPANFGDTILIRPSPEGQRQTPAQALESLARALFR